MTPRAILYAPAAYWSLSRVTKNALTNGCGPSGWLRHLVPDTNYGLDIKPVCDIHDYMYVIGTTIDDKRESDRVMLNNHLRWIDAKTRWQWLRALRYRRARDYYEAVEHFGGPAFWAGKNPVETMQEA